MRRFRKRLILSALLATSLSLVAAGPASAEWLHEGKCLPLTICMN